MAKNKEPSSKFETFSSKAEIDRALLDICSRDPVISDSAKKLIEDNIKLGRQSRTELFGSYVLVSNTQQETRDMLDEMGAPLNIKNEILSPRRRFEAWKSENDERTMTKIRSAEKKIREKYANTIFSVITFLTAVFALAFGYLTR